MPFKGLDITIFKSGVLLDQWSITILPTIHTGIKQQSLGWKSVAL